MTNHETVENIVIEPKIETDIFGTNWITEPQSFNPPNPNSLIVFRPDRSTPIIHVEIFPPEMSKKNDKVLKKPGEQCPNPKRRPKKKPDGDYFRHTKNSPTPNTPPGSKKTGN